MPLGTVTQLGHYKVQSLIGMGGMGEVYRAVDTKLEREVAIEFCRPRWRTVRSGWRGLSARRSCWRN